MSWKRLTLNDRERREIENHLETTRDSMIKAYTVWQLAFLDWIDTRTVKNSWKYLPIRFENREARYEQRIGENRKWYTIRRVRVDEIKYIFNKRNLKTRLVEDYK